MKQLISLLNADDGKRIQLIISTETYSCCTSKGKIRKNEEIKGRNMIRQYKND